MQVNEYLQFEVISSEKVDKKRQNVKPQIKQTVQKNTFPLKGMSAYIQ